MPMTSKDMEKLILADGWIREKGKATGHRQYTHLSKPGKVTIPFSSRKNFI